MTCLYRFVIVLSLLIYASLMLGPQPAYAVTAPPGFQVTTVTGGLAAPTSVAFATDGRILIAQKSGAVRLIKNGVLQSQLVVQLTDINDFGDRGLAGIALDPNFSVNGYIYLAYTYENTPGQNYTGMKTGRIVRLTMSGDTANLSTKIVLVGTVGGDSVNPSCRNFATTTDCIVSDSNTHSMGAIHFGPDGKLYATLGDGSGYVSVDPWAHRALDIKSLAGKILRINADGTAPADNPFYDGNPNDNQSKVYMLGLRNPYRFSFRPTDGTLFFGDVGWTAWEELNVGVRGANYGWPCREGYSPTDYNCTTTTAAKDPIYVYDHSSGSGSVMGGVFMGSAYPSEYQGSYVFGDYSNSYLKRLVLNADNSVASVQDFVTFADGPVDIQVGLDGSIYYVAINKGELRKITFSSTNRPPVANISANPTLGASPLLVHFSSINSTDPDNDPLSYLWDFGDGQSTPTGNPDHTYTANGTYTVTLTVTDSHGATANATTVITVGDAALSNANPHHVSTSITPSPTHIGDETTITSSVRNDGAASPFIVDMEVYDSTNVKVAQKVFDNQTIPTGATVPFAMPWMPPALGDYTVKLGLFKSGWSGLYEWNNLVLGVSVLARSPVATSTPAFIQTTTLSNAAPAVGSTQTISTLVQNTGGAGDALVDIEVYKDGVKIGQKFFDNQNFAANESKNFTFDMVIPSAGDYRVSVGIFKPGWSALYGWFTDTPIFTAGGVAPPPPSSVVNIYQDALASGWENWSWGSTINFSDTSQVSEGSNSIKVTFASAWAGFFLHNQTGINTAGKNTLQFTIAGNGSSGQQVQVYVYDSSGVQLIIKNVSQYISGGITLGTFKTVSIPLADLDALNKTISAIVFQEASGSGGASINLDAIKIQ